MSNRQILIRVPEEMAKEMEKVAKDLHQSKNFIVSEALRFYLRERADLDVALDRLRDPNAEWISHHQVKREILDD